MRNGGNLLMLDEPTNDLDVDTLRALEDAILSFAGRMLLARWLSLCWEVVKVPDCGKGLDMLPFGSGGRKYSPASAMQCELLMALSLPNWVQYQLTHSVQAV